MKNVFIALAILAQSSLAYSREPLVFDRCQIEPRKYDIQSRILTKIVKDKLVIQYVKANGDHSVSEAIYKIIKSSHTTFERNVITIASLVSSDIWFLRNYSSLRFETVDTLYYGDPEATLSFKSNSSSAAPLVFFGLVCDLRKSSSQELRFQWAF